MNYAEALRELIKDKTSKLAKTYDEEEIIKLKSRISAYKESLSLYLEHFTDNIISGDIYYVINYENGNKANPVIDKMKLYKITKSKNGRSTYFFSYALKRNEWLARKPDLVIKSKAMIEERVFTDLKSAEEKLGI